MATSRRAGGAAAWSMRRKVSLSWLFAGRPYSTPAQVLAFIDRFNQAIADVDRLPADVLTYLDTEGDDPMAAVAPDGVLDTADRDYWIDRVIREDGITLSGGRLPADPWGDFDANEARYYGSDPLGLGENKTNVVVIDKDNTDHAVYCKPGDNSNLVFEDADYLIDAEPVSLWTGHNTALEADQEYQHQLWGDILSLSETLNNPGNRRRFPIDGREAIVYIRGGDYELIQPDFLPTVSTVNLTKNTDAWIAPSRIVIRNYPGETVRIFMRNCQHAANEQWDNDPIFLFARPDVHFIGIECVGYQGTEAVDRVYAPYMFSITSTGDSAKFLHCRLGKHRGIPTTHADKDAFPHLVDFGFDERSSSGSTTLAESSSLIVYRILNFNNSQDVEVRNCRFEAAARTDTPIVGIVDALGTIVLGESVQFSGGASGRVVASSFVGIQTHGQIRLDDTDTTNRVHVEQNDVENHDNSCVLSIGSFNTIKRNRIHSYCSLGDDGHGINVAGSDCVITENVVFNHNPLPAEAATNFGIWVAGARLSQLIQRNEASYNICYQSHLHVGVNSSPPASDNGACADNDLHHNVVIGVNSKAVANSANYDGPLISNFGPEAADPSGNVCRNNLLGRLDGSTRMYSRRKPGSAPNSEGHAENDIQPTHTTWQHNAMCDPWYDAIRLFRDAANDDFTPVIGSDAAVLLAGHNLPFTAADAGCTLE